MQSKGSEESQGQCWLGVCNFHSIYSEAALPGTRLLARPLIWHMKIYLFSPIFIYSCYYVSEGRPPPRDAAPTTTSSPLFSEVVPSLGSLAQFHWDAYHHNYNHLHTVGNFTSRARNHSSSLITAAWIFWADTVSEGSRQSTHVTRLHRALSRLASQPAVFSRTQSSKPETPWGPDFIFFLPNRRCHAFEEGVISAILMISFLSFLCKWMLFPVLYFLDYFFRNWPGMSI